MLVCSQDSTFEHLCTRRLHCTPVAAARQAMASLPPEPAEGCTLRVEIQPRNEAPRRLERKFDGDDTGEMVLRWLAAEGCADCFQDWRLYRVDVHPEVVIEEAFSTQTLQSLGLWPSARLALRPRPTYRITVRTAVPGRRMSTGVLRRRDRFSDSAARVREAASLL